MTHISIIQENHSIIRHEYYLDNDMEVPEDRRKVFCVLYEYVATDTIKTYDEWVRYFLDHGTLIKLAETFAASKMREVTVDADSN